MSQQKTIFKEPNVMKNLFTCIVLVIGSTSTSAAQFFSGELVYEQRIIPKKPGLNADSIAEQSPGTSMIYLITRHYYKTTYFKGRKETYSYTYHDDEKRMYDEDVDRNFITYRDSRKGNTNMIRSIIYKDSTRKVAGHICFMTESVYESYIQKTYYATDLRIDPESFRGHEVGNWYNEIKQVNGALSLMSINEYATHFEISEVVKITPRNLKPEDFALPSNKKIIASSLALDKQVSLIPPSVASEACYRKKIGEARATETFTCYVGMIIGADGKISNAEPYEKDPGELYKIAVDILLSCGLEFHPGEIGSKPVSSWVYFPVTFQKQ